MRAFRQSLFLVSLSDLVAILILILGGFIYHFDARHWGIAYIGDHQYGDAEFWWNGAIHFSKGLLLDNPVRGYRPGHMITAGLSVALLGSQFLVFHKLLLTLFMTAASIFYLALRDYMGRLAAFLGICAIVFNPYTAEWTATSTTEGVGLVLHFISLACLLNGLREKRIKKVWLAGFGFFFALGTLTRPLIAPFWIAVVIAVALFAPGTRKERLKGVLSITLACLLPIFTWMSIQKLSVGQWTINQVQALELYAPSDPKIQTWNPGLLSWAEDLIRNERPEQAIDYTAMYQEVSRRTLENYRLHWKYHLARLVPHYRILAEFGPHRAARPSTLFKQIFVSAFVALSLIFLAWRRKWLGLLVFLAIAIAYVKWPLQLNALLLGLGVIAGTFYGLKNKNQFGFALLCLFWIAGGLVLAVTGGTWGFAGTAAAPDINALGYRLGTQFLYIGDIIVFWSFGGLLSFFLGRSPSVAPRLNQISPALSLVVNRALIVLISVFFAIEAIGASIVAYRWYQTRGPKQAYPSIAPVSVWLRKSYPELDRHPIVVAPTIDTVRHHIWRGDFAAKNSPLVVTTGTGTEFIWNMPGQERSQMLFYPQENISPFKMVEIRPGFTVAQHEPNKMILEFSEHLLEDTWRYRQGAYIFRTFADVPRFSSQAYYLAEHPTLCFVPLSEDKKDWNFSKATCFGMKKYASQLFATGELKFKNSLAPKWMSDSGPLPFKRRFILTNDTTMTVDLRTSIGARTLSFELDNRKVHIVVKNQAEKILFDSQLSPLLAKVDLKISDIEKGPLSVDIRGVPPEGLAIYEFNLGARNFR